MQRILVFTLLLLSSSLGFSQFKLETSQVFGGNSLDDAQDLALNNDSSVVFLGARTFSTDGDIPANNGGTDFWIMKRNVPSGTLIWNKTYGGFNNDDLSTVMAHSDGGVVAFGTTRNEQGTFGDLTGLAGAWLIRINNAGTITSGKIFGGDIAEKGVDAFRSNNGDITMAIEATSPTLNGEDNNGINDVWIVKADNVFSIKWSTLLGGSRQDSPTAITSDAAGNIYVAATSESDLEGLGPNNGGIDMWIIKLNSTGDVVWQKNFGGAGDDVPTDILVGPDGAIYVTANSTSVDGDFDANYGFQDFWLFRLDAGNGNVVFSNNYGGPGNDVNAVLSNFGSQHLAISATSNSDSVDLTGNKGFNDLWVLTTTLDGSITNQMNYGGSLNDLSGDIVVVDSVFYLLNTTLSADKNVPANSYSQQDLWYLTLDASPDECSGQLKCIPDSVTTNEIFPPASDVLTCTGGCTAGLQAGPSFLQGLCGDFTESTAFFKLTTDTMADLLTLTVETNEFNSPRIAVMRSNNCGPFTPIYCETGSNGFLLMPYLEIDPLITYIIAISDADGNVGDFDFCASSIDVEFCNNKDTLYVTNTSLGSPLTGPFRPGEEVRFCYELQDWNKLDCNGFQGLIPTFGPAWDPDNFDSFGMPLEIDDPLDPIAMGSWNWHKVGDVRYNVTNPISGYAGGQGMPAGWYFTNTSDAPPNDGPDQTTGDIFHCLTTLDDWKMCFTLQVEDECEENLDATITMRSFSDGELGVNTSLACAYDKEQILPMEMICCRNPELQVIQEISVCSGDTLILYPESNILGPVTYTWIADPDIGIEGASSGTELQRFYQVLTNETNNILKVRYILSAQGVNCEADPIIFTVRVFPQPTSRITITGPNIVCSGTPVTLNFENGGTPPFAIEIFRDNEFFANVLSETFQISIEIDPVSSGRFRVGNVSDAFCEGEGLGFVNVTVKPVGSHSIDTTLCEGGSIIVGGEIIDEGGTYILRLEGAAENNCDSVISLSLTLTPSMTQIINEEICNGDTLFVLGQPYTETTEELIGYTGPSGCMDFIDLHLTVTDTFMQEIDQTICFGDTLNFEGVGLFSSGVYSHVEETEPGCFTQTVLTLLVLPRILINDLEIIGDNGNTTGAILVELTGGSPPFTYSWSSGQNTESIFNVAHGSYSLSVADSRGCTEVFTFNVPMATGTQDIKTNGSFRVWPTILSAGQTAHVYSVDDHTAICKEFSWWTSGGQRVDQKNLTAISGTGIETIIVPESISAGIYFIRFISQKDELSWQKVMVR